MPRDLTFEAIKLLSQRIVSNPDKIPEGYVLQATSCMNPEDAELVGLAYVLLKRNERRNPERAKRLRQDILPMLEIIGLSKWIKGEVTHLGLRAGLRYLRQEDLGKQAEDKESPVVEDAIDEATIFAKSGSDKE